MKINSFNTVNTNPYAKQNISFPGQREERVLRRDELQISSEAKELQSTNPLFAAEGQEKIREIKTQIDKGNYHINTMEVARKFYEYWK